MSDDGTSILFGTRGASVYEISAIDGSDLRGGPIAIGHYSGTVKSIAVHPSKFEFVTVGDDKTLRVYDMNTKSQIKLANFDGDVSVAIYSPVGDTIAVGFAGAAKGGAVMILNDEDLVVAHEARDSKQAVTCIAYSNEGETLAVGGEDGSILLYSIHDDYELIAKCERHTGAIVAIDFSTDGEWIRSNSMNRELCFFNSDDGAFLSNTNSMRDVTWATNTCIYTWHMRAVHDGPYAAEEVLCAHTPPSTTHAAVSEGDELPPPQASQLAEYLAAGSNMGYVTLHPFPCVRNEKKKTEFHRYPSHSGAVSGVRFSFDAKRLISVGRHDRCVVQWSCVTKPRGIENKVSSEEKESEDLALEVRAANAIEAEFMPSHCDIPVGKLNSTMVGQAEILPSPENDVWVSALVDPTVIPKQNKSVPDMSLMLDYVYGYEAQKMRNNVRYTASGDIAYVVATLGVVLNVTSRSQNIFKVLLHRSNYYSISISISISTLTTIWNDSFTQMPSPRWLCRLMGSWWRQVRSAIAPPWRCGIRRPVAIYSFSPRKTVQSAESAASHSLAQRNYLSSWEWMSSTPSPSTTGETSSWSAGATAALHESSACASLSRWSLLIPTNQTSGS
jgi:WD40 repeat protein